MESAERRPMTDSANRDLKPIRKWLGRRSVLFHWMRRRAESAGFLFLLILLVPLGAARMIGGTANPPDLRALWARWRRFLLHGLHDLRCAYWPGIRYERAADVWFHVVLIELFSVLDATAKPMQKPGGSPRILVVKLAHFGDALHIFPMMRELRRQRPEARIDLLVGPWCEGLARTFGLHDELILQTPRLGLFERGGESGRRRLGEELRWLLELRRRQYDLVFSTSTTTLSEVLLMYALRARRWVGTLLPTGLYEPEGDAHLVPYDSRKYEAERVMGLLALAGINGGDSELFYPISAEDTAAAEALLREAGLPEKGRFAVLCPGAGWPGKQWMPERFAEVGGLLRHRAGLSVVLVGSAGEKNLGDEVARHMQEPVLRLAGRTTLGQLAAVLSRAALFVGNDSGPMHLAACFKVPSVVLFGPTIAAKWAPRHSASRCLQHEDCAGCISWHYRANCLHGNRCMKAIPVDEVWSAAEWVLQPRAGEKDCR